MNINAIIDSKIKAGLIAGGLTRNSAGVAGQGLFAGDDPGTQACWLDANRQVK